MGHMVTLPHHSLLPSPPWLIFIGLWGPRTGKQGLIVSSAIPCLNLGILGWLACGAHSHHLRRALGSSVDHDVDHDVGAEWRQNYSKVPSGEGLHWHRPLALAFIRKVAHLTAILVLSAARSFCEYTESH